MGCERECLECHNIQFKDKNYSVGTKKFTVEELIQKLGRSCKENNTNKVVLSGGDPLSAHNFIITKKLLLNEQFDFCIYTGQSIEQVRNYGIKGFKFIKTEKFNPILKQLSEKTNSYFQLASQNQKLFDHDFVQLTRNGRMYF